MNNYNSDWTIFETLAGSHLYGTNTPESDIDIRGVCIPPASVRDNPFQNFEQQEFPGEDKVIYSLKKFFQLASDCNPNIIELIFSTGNSVTVWTHQWERIYNNRHLFLSTKAKFTFTGYAFSQLKRIKLHREWLLNPPKEKPEREHWDLPETPIWGFEKLQNLIYAPEECIQHQYRRYALNEMSYRSAKEYWDNYDKWQKTRNPKRAALEAHYGYDTKHGSRLYRLLTQGLELLETGHITLPRPDKDVLLDIRNGKYTYDQLMEMTKDFEDRINNCNSVLPKNPNISKLADLYQELINN